MELGNDLIASLRERIGGLPQEVDGPVFDWAGLHARLAAGYAARCALADAQPRNCAVAGGFEGWEALRAPGNASRLVNRTDSTDGKAVAGIRDGVAGQVDAGNRGQ